MKHAAVGCGIGLASWLAMAGALSWLLQWRWQVAWVDTLGVSALAGLLGWASLNLLHAAWQAGRERAAIASGGAGRAPADGQRAVLVGTLEALDPLAQPLRAPLDGSACLAYEYKITEDRGSGKRRTILTHYRGSGLVPSEIVTRSGRYRLLTVPDLQASPPATPSSGHMPAFERYARSTPFITRAAEVAQELVERWSDDDGAHRSDVCYTPLDQLDLTRCMLTQQQVKPGARVCVIGTYSAERRAIVPSPTWAGNPRLIEGDVQGLVQTLGASARNRLLLGLAIAACAAALVAAFVADVVAG